MTFLVSVEDRNKPVENGFSTSLSQRGRSGMEFLGAIQNVSSGEMRACARSDFYSAQGIAALDEEHKKEPGPVSAIRQRINTARGIAESLPMYRLERFLQRYVAEENFNFGIPAIEERREQFEAVMHAEPKSCAGGSLELSPGMEVPKYYTNVNWHLEPGGWDGYDLYGALFAFAVGPYVFSKGGYAAVSPGQDITQQRVKTIRQLPKDRYKRIFEPGCGGVTTFRAIHSVYPDAELVGCDLSPLLLTNGHRLAERSGLKVELKQREITRTGELDESVDAVVTYALHHELPPKENAKLFTEMFRILEPNGDIILSDPPPFRVVDLFHAVILDWDTKNRDEPFFTEVLLSSLEDQLQDAGFVDIEAFAIGPDCYPWITRARKPMKEERSAL